MGLFEPSGITVGTDRREVRYTWMLTDKEWKQIRDDAARAEVTVPDWLRLVYRSIRDPKIRKRVVEDAIKEGG